MGAHLLSHAIKWPDEANNPTIDDLDTFPDPMCTSYYPPLKLEEVLGDSSKNVERRGDESAMDERGDLESDVGDVLRHVSH